jgi:hypothetical protein
VLGAGRGGGGRGHVTCPSAAPPPGCPCTTTRMPPHHHRDAPLPPPRCPCLPALQTASRADLEGMKHALVLHKKGCRAETGVRRAGCAVRWCCCCTAQQAPLGRGAGGGGAQSAWVERAAGGDKLS